ncbi:hypothetical protein CH289_07585 [Rhodococcus sp. RS1C4]|nr:acyltransferase family protein [Rhodococcus sp. RS1C4]OZC55047.1 hypothetical protein CH289_07585 [Rhodococcus sp. RS1C4]
MDKGRLAWMDTLRGLAIVMLVFWHSAAIPVYYGFDMPRWLYLINEVFLPWRMPALMFLSGLLLSKSLRKPAIPYYVGKVRLLAWPYLIWAAVHMLTFPYFDGELTSPRAWIANGYLWFIFFLLVYYVVAPAVVRLRWWIAMPLIVAAALITPSAQLQQLMYFAVFFFTGYYVHRLMESVTRWSPPIVVGVIAIAVSFTVVSLYKNHDTDTHFFQYEVLSIPASFALILLSVRIAAAMASTNAAVSSLQFVGRNSVVFYLLHFPVITAVCSVASEFGWVSSLWVVPASWVAALAVGVGFALGRHSLAVAWLFEAPGFLTSRIIKITDRSMTS